MNNVEGKVVVITGASSGIGEQTARSLVAEGARVVLSARREDRLASLAAELGEDNAAYLASDVSKLEDMQALVAEFIDPLVVELAPERFGRVDVLFANAGIMPAGPMSAMDHAGWMAQVDINVKGVLNAMAAVLPDFTGQRRGHIIATSSVAGTTLVPYNAVYCGTKHFVRAMLSSFRSESVMEGTNIRTTVIYPGKIATELLNSAAEGPGKEAARKAYAAEAIPAGAIADAVLYAVGQPDSVDVSDIVVRPTAEA